MCENDNMMIMKEYRNLYEITITHYVEIRTMYFHTSNIFDKEIFFWYYDLDDKLLKLTSWYFIYFVFDIFKGDLISFQEIKTSCNREM